MVGGRNHCQAELAMSGSSWGGGSASYLVPPCILPPPSPPLAGRCSKVLTVAHLSSALEPAGLAASEPQDEVGELKRRLAVTAHQADQLKGEVAARDGELQREKYDKAKVSGWCTLAGLLLWSAGSEASMAGGWWELWVERPCGRP